MKTTIDKTEEQILSLGRKISRKRIFENTKTATNKFNRNSETTKLFFSDIIEPKINKQVDIGVKNIDTVSSAVNLSKLGRTCILNMASASKPGGGVAYGEQAQEECLFRCSNLWETVTEDFYPLKDDECLYTKNAVFFKDSNYNFMEPIVVDVVTIASINLNENSYYDEDNECWVDGIVEKQDNYEEITKNKIRLMLSAAINNDIENIVLGAWGCGVFKNDPDEIATMFHDVLMEGYAHSFNIIEFAIINDENSVSNNYVSFLKKFNQYD